eukprot:ANDGO_06105.mRNA.1 N-alpha-acetyltransferase 20
MSVRRRFVAHDLFYFNPVNLDFYTETYNLGFYFDYLCRWPDYFLMQESPDGQCMGYIMGKAESPKTEWHGHVTAVTVAPAFRRLGVAANLMHLLEDISDKVYRAYFVDLFVRSSNKIAISMYKGMGYSVYRRVVKYYSGPHVEDAFDMRKAMPRDPKKLSERPYPRDVQPEELETTMSLPHANSSSSSSSSLAASSSSSSSATSKKKKR